MKVKTKRPLDDAKFRIIKFKLIAKIFFLMGLFENCKDGTLEVVSGSIEAGKTSSKFYFEDEIFRLVQIR